jgi:hypothetical protein
MVMDPDKIMDGISKELSKTLSSMAKAKTPEDRLQYSEVVKNLCESLGVFLSFASGMIPYDDEEWS